MDTICPGLLTSKTKNRNLLLKSLAEMFFTK